MVRLIIAILSVIVLSGSVLACKSPAQKAEEYDKAYTQGYALTQEGKHAEAIVYYQKAIRLMPNDAKTAGAYNDLGWSYQQTGRLQEAIKAYKQALALNPNLALAKNNLAAAEATAEQQPQ